MTMTLLGRLTSYSNFKVGAAVILKAGGPNMLIFSIKGDTCTCMWVGSTGKIAMADFNKVGLCNIEEYSELFLQAKGMLPKEK